jgi:RNA polymerase sigma-70 factor (ECF subfamily)
VGHLPNEGANTAVARPAGSDASVIAASIADHELFAELFRRHAPTVHRYLARRIGPEAADDCLAEVFLAAFRRRERYDPRFATALPWLYGIAAHVVAQHRREDAHRWRLLGVLSPEPDDPGHADAASERVSAQSQRGALMRGLASLSEGDREVLLLVAWEQLSPTEAALALAIPAGTARTRLHRARRQLRAHLDRFDALDPIDDASPPRASLEELLGHE